MVLIRESQTMLEINLAVETRDEKRLKELIDKYRGLVKDYIEKLSGKAP